jgi:hypothetical protein
MAVAPVLVLAPVADAHSTAPLTLVVNYSYTGEISVTLPNGTPVGTKGGSPTVIPAGYYNVELSQPGCVDTPAFIMQGPGVNILDDLQSGEIVTDAVAAILKPNSTYTWRDGSINPPVYYTFATSGVVVGTPPVPTKAAPVTLSKNPQVNHDVVGAASPHGSQAAPYRGKLVGTVTAGGVPMLASSHGQVGKLAAGRYSISVTDRSTTRGFTLDEGTYYTLGVTGTSFVGTRTTMVTLTAGTWSFRTVPTGRKFTFIVVAP